MEFNSGFKGLSFIGCVIVNITAKTAGSCRQRLATWKSLFHIQNDTDYHDDGVIWFSLAPPWQFVIMIMEFIIPLLSSDKNLLDKRGWATA